MREQRHDCYDYIRRYYDVPAYIGVRVSVEGKSGVLVKARSALHYAHVKFDGAKFSVPCHPSELTYHVQAIA